MWAHRSGQEVAGEIHKSRIPILLSAAGFCNCFMCGNCFGARDVLPAGIFARAAGREGAYPRLSAGTGDFLLLNRGGCATINTIAGAGPKGCAQAAAAKLRVAASHAGKEYIKMKTAKRHWT